MARTKALLRRGDRTDDPTSPQQADPSSAQQATPSSARQADRAAGLFHFRDLTIDRDKKKVMIRDQRLELTPKEFDLLRLMADSPGKTFGRHELLERIWGFAFQEYEHTITAHINRLRIKLENNPNKPEYILTTWGTGYRFAE